MTTSTIVKKSKRSRSQKGGNPTMKLKSKSRSQKGGNPTMKPKSKSRSHKGGAPTLNQTQLLEQAQMQAQMQSQMQSQMQAQMGGSPASNLVMEATTGEPVMNDYISSPRIRDSSNDTSSCQSGGSSASDMVMSNLTADAKTVAYPEGFKVKGNINSINSYAPSGGFRCRKGRKGGKSKKQNKSKKSHNKNKKSKKSNRKFMMRGGSDWISSQYSLGNINNQMGSTGDFSVSQGVDRNTLMNPPNMGLAGSGSPMSALEGANVHSVGSPLV